MGGKLPKAKRQLPIVGVNFLKYQFLGVALFGGYEKAGSKAVISKVLKVNPHYKLKIKVLWAKIDSWDNEAA